MHKNYKLIFIVLVELAGSIINYSSYDVTNAFLVTTYSLSSDSLQLVLI